MLEALAAAATVIAGPVLYRMRGGLPPSLPRPVDLGLWAGLLTAPLWFLTPWWAAALSFAAAFGATSTAHGEGIDFGKAEARDLTEWANYPTQWVLGHKRDGPLYDTVYMVFNGLPMTVVAGAALAWFTSPWLVVVALAGALKGPAYWLGFQTPSVARHFNRGSEWGEAWTGLLVAAAMAPLWLLV